MLEKGRYFLEESIDITKFIQHYRRLANITSLKLKLNDDEKEYVDNNRFMKIQVSEHSSSDENAEKHRIKMTDR